MRAPNNSIASDSSFDLVEIHQAEFDAIWHYHDAFELTHIKRGEGRRFVGSSVENFREGDLVLLGSGIPHFWQSTRSHRPWNAVSTTVHFDPQRLALDGEDPAELDRVRSLLHQAAHGVVFSSIPEVADQLAAIDRTSGWRHYHGLVEILGSLADRFSTHGRLLSNEPIPPGNPKHAPSEDPRLVRSLHSILFSLPDPISLNDAAFEATMQRFAFCRFFKRAIGCGFSDFVTRTRLAIACEKLESDRASIASIASSSGFRTLSNFHRAFKDHVGTTPHRYRRDRSRGRAIA